ncbi:MAG: bifunctional serine/threonine-protein kinase/formylglycine-generating enzyme family protein [Kofleriaceae bacterium]
MGKGSALLAAGFGLGKATQGLTSLVSQIGESLMSIGFSAKRLAPMPGERDGADRMAWKSSVAELSEAKDDTILIAMAGRIVRVNDTPCIVAALDTSRYPEETTVPLEWIRERLRECLADRVVVVGSFEGEGTDREWLDMLATKRERHLIAVERANGAALGLHALLDGLRGEAIDLTTGTVTLRSLVKQLRARVPDLRMQATEESVTLASLPQLAGPWDSRLTSRRNTGVRPTEPEDLVGTVLPGRFKLENAIARGSFGNVYVAHQLSVDRFVAVKVLHGAVAASEAGRLFVQEIAAVGRLDHPNIVKIYQADMTPSGILFYAMELLAGRDLQQLVEAEKKVEKTRAILLGRQLASALGAAHEVGLVHADVKPANAFVVDKTGDERLVLLDFGLARLRGDDASAGGTPAYMAPEQLRDGRVDSRSDVFSAGLVMVTMLTGWRRKSHDQIVPPLDGIDSKLRAVLAKALALDPNERYQTGKELALALGDKRPTKSIAVASPPFRHLASFTEEDRDRLYGRDLEISTLVEHVVFRNSVVYTAPTGTGKTSLLRAGLMARIDALGMTGVYVACHSHERPDLQGPIAAARVPGKRIVLIVDQIEAALKNHEFVDELQTIVRDPTMSSVLSVREDVLASLLNHLDARSDVLRLGPLGSEGAREAIVGPLIERRVTMEEQLLDRLLADLERAAALIAPEMRWQATGPMIYPPHLQLACSTLFERLQPGEEQITLRHYESLGGLDEIVREYLDRVIETELPGDMVPIARRVLAALVDSDRNRAVRTDSELAEMVPGHDLAKVLEALRTSGVIVPLRAASGQAAWELVHDSLVPRVLQWVDREALERQRALEIVRHHLRGSTKQRPSVLTRRELREVRPYHDSIELLDVEWAKRIDAAWVPTELVAHSRRFQRNRLLAIVLSAVTIVSVATFLIYRAVDERNRRMREELMARADLGSFTLELQTFDWDPKAQAAIDVAPPPDLDWTLYDPDSDDPLAPSTNEVQVQRTDETPGIHALRWHVIARGGTAILVVKNRGTSGQHCAPSVIPLDRLPGHAKMGTNVHVPVRVPTCQASLVDTIEIPAGPFRADAKGDPRVDLGSDWEASAPPTTTADVKAFRIDRLEVSNAAYQQLTHLVSDTVVDMPTYVAVQGNAAASSPRAAVTFVSFSQARAFCRFVGKDLPDDLEWQKASHGGLTIDGLANPRPERVLPWGTSDVDRAHISDVGGPGVHDVDADANDRSPYGVLDMAGNVSEWTRTILTDSVVTRGCTWEPHCTRTTLAVLLAIPNVRAKTFMEYGLGFRCVDEEAAR